MMMRRTTRTKAVMIPTMVIVHLMTVVVVNPMILTVHLTEKTIMIYLTIQNYKTLIMVFKMSGQSQQLS